MTYTVRETSMFARADRHRSHHRKASDFPVGTRVRVVCDFQDFMFFGPGGMKGPTGEVIRNGDRYLGIIVKWDKPRAWHSNDVYCTSQRCSDETHALWQTEFNFDPDDLIIEGEVYRDPTAGRP